MKTIFIPLFASILIVAGCCSVKNTTQNEKMQIVNAQYHKWSEPPVTNSDVPEKGVDLAVTVKNWPKEALPEHIIYQNRKSFSPKITDTTDVGVVMNARIIVASSVMEDTSDEVELSDRLVYKTAKGDTSYIAIEQWERMKE